jgi:hypothetical protein
VVSAKDRRHCHKIIGKQHAKLVSANVDRPEWARLTNPVSSDTDHVNRASSHLLSKQEPCSSSSERACMTVRPLCFSCFVQPHPDSGPSVPIITHPAPKHRSLVLVSQPQPDRLSLNEKYDAVAIPLIMCLASPIAWAPNFSPWPRFLVCKTKRSRRGLASTDCLKQLTPSEFALNLILTLFGS